MNQGFSSKALEVNLENTRDQDKSIPLEQQWFLDLSADKWGIHKRTKEFIEELNHSFRNYSFVVEALHNICLTDLWFYSSLEESEHAFSVLVDIFKDLAGAIPEEREQEFLIQTMIKFMERLASLEECPERILALCLDFIREDIPRKELLYIRNSGYFKTYLNKVAQLPAFNQEMIQMTKHLLNLCIEHWEGTAPVEQWFQDKRDLFQFMDSRGIEPIGKGFYQRLRMELSKAQTWDQVRSLMFFNDISNYYRNFTDKFVSKLETIHYIFFLLHLPGMAQLNDHLLYDMNRNLRGVFQELEEGDITSFLDDLGEQFADLQKEHGSTLLDCITTLGHGILDTKNQVIITYFVKGLIRLGFHHPGTPTLSSDWQICINKNHVKNIRIWLDLIEYAPFATKELLAALIVNLKMGGIFISDTDVFQRDVTKLLNADIAPVYREMKQLAKIFPVYFRDIGAEGALRETTTAADELSLRKDRLLHFLRKQIHTESNNTHIDLTYRIIRYWYDGDKEKLQGHVPEDVFKWLDTDSEWFVDVHRIVTLLCQKLESTVEELLELDKAKLRLEIESLPVDNPRDKKRVADIFEVYEMVLEKYSLETENITALLKDSGFFEEAAVDEFQRDLDRDKKRLSLSRLLGFMRHLKAIILNPQVSEAQENIYYKRHIAVGIPSMYGQYKEKKFDALGLMYRLERVVSKMMVELMQSVNPQHITAKTFRRIYDVLELFVQGLDLDGIHNQGLNSHLDMLQYGLTSPSFSFEQNLNIFQFIADDIRKITEEYFFDVFQSSLKKIIPQIFPEMEGQSETQQRQFYHMESEKFLRDNLYSAFLVQDLDNFITNIISALQTMADTYSREWIQKMMTYDPDLSFSLLYEENKDIDNPVFLGAKAFFLKKLTGYGFPVPPGFILTTEIFRHREMIDRNPNMSLEVDNLIQRGIRTLEQKTGLKYGDPENPLFFSVRSGSSFSMPGSMQTFLNVGMNDEIAEALGKRKGYYWTAWDCYRRFLQSWGMSHGMERDLFDQVMSVYKDRFGVELKMQFAPEQMKTIAMAYKDLLKEYGFEIEQNLFQQLRYAVFSVSDSWNSESAKCYRQHIQIADQWGTAVLIQKMVLGNMSTSSGTGVVFTCDPFEDPAGIHLYGDLAICSQGEDVVSGLIHTLPITEKQRRKDYKDASLSLESAFPATYDKLLTCARQLIEQYGYVHQEIEFTFESDKPEDFYILQTRNQKLKQQSATVAFAPQPYEMKLVGRGLGVSNSVLTGRVAFDMADIDMVRARYPEEKVILVRPDTVPDDIPLIFSCDGLVTGRGGTTSHAAVTASSLGRVCIVSCKGLKVNDDEKQCGINGHLFYPGDVLSIDGRLGNIYEGSYEIIED